MVSHRKLGGIEISLGQGGLRFKKRPSWFNVCVGKAMRGTPGPSLGRYDKDFQAKFTEAARSCAGKAKPSEKVAVEKKAGLGILQ